MKYKKYQKSRDMAWQVLIREGVKELPVDVVGLCRRMGIRVQYYIPQDDNDGFCTMVRGKPRIFVSKLCSAERQRFTIAHELGHILLGHLGLDGLVNREPAPGDNEIEREANVFASRILAPACVLWALDVRSPEEIAALCRISRQAAAFRAARMELLYARNRFLASPLEREVYRQFGEFIQERRGTSGPM